MSRLQKVLDRYDAARAVAEYGVSIFSVGDPAGAQLNAAIRRTLFVLGDERSDVWTDLLQVANALRWRRMTQPQPNAYQPAQAQIVEEILYRTKRLRHLIGDESLLDQLAAAATAVSETDSPVGTLLLESLLESGARTCAVVASRGSARAGLESWLGQFGITVVLPSGLDGLPADIEQSFVVAPPSFVPSSLVTAPATSEITFVTPTWFGNCALPVSGLGPHAEGRSEIKTTVHLIGDTAKPMDAVPDEAEVNDTYFPQPDWGDRSSEDRKPESDEAEAWKILLAGGMGLWLDDGDRIRSLDPTQPEGDRVEYERVSDISPGTYLVLREGETERGAMYEQALVALGPLADGISASQDRWKSALKKRLIQVGAYRASDELSTLGIQSARQVRVWVEPWLICPQRDSDFRGLLEWLGVPVQPTYGNAINLRRAIYKVSAGLRKELEVAVGKADLSVLERDGIVRLDLPREGFRGMFVARVLARSPFTEIVARHHIRVPFSDRSAQWLD